MSKTFGEESVLDVSSRERLRRGAVASAALASTAATIAISAGASSAKSRRPSRPAAAGKITVLAYGDSQNTAEQYAVAAYNNTSMGKKVKAVLSTIPGANYQTKLQTIMSTSSAPDVFFNWGGGSICSSRRRGCCCR